MKTTKLLMLASLFALLIIPTFLVSADSDTKPPVIYIWEPSGKAVVTTDYVIVKGQATDPSGVQKVTVNGGIPIIKNRDPRAPIFEKRISLPWKGTFGIVVIAVDNFGNRAEKRFTVTRR